MNQTLLKSHLFKTVGQHKKCLTIFNRKHSWTRLVGGSVNRMVRSGYGQNTVGKIIKELMKMRKNNHKMKLKNHTGISKFILKRSALEIANIIFKLAFSVLHKILL